MLDMDEKHILTIHSDGIICASKSLCSQCQRAKRLRLPQVQELLNKLDNKERLPSLAERAATAKKAESDSKSTTSGKSSEDGRMESTEQESAAKK